MNYFTNDGLALAYRVDGDADAPALVFSNSLGTNLHLWDAQVAALAPHFRIVRYDTRGHGLSDVPATPPTLAELGGDVVALLDHLAIARAHVCGISLGGLTALWVVAYHPQRVARAVFANTGARIGSVASWTERIAAVRAGGMAAVREAVIGRFLSTDFRAAQPEMTAAVTAMLLNTNPDGYSAVCEAIRDADLRPVVAAISVPALIIAGGLDESTPPALSDELHAAISDSQILVLPRVAHLSNIEQPDRFNALLLDFLRAA